MKRLNFRKLVLQDRKRCWLVSTALLIAIFGSCEISRAAAPSAASVAAKALIETELHHSIASATRDEIIQVLQTLIARNPKNAADLIAAIGQVHRPSQDCEISKFVTAALADLGDQATRPVVLAIVENAVTAEPRCAPAIVTAAIKANQTFADDIVQTAVAALPDPTILIGDITIVEVITNAAFAALNTDLPPIGEGPGADATGILASANLGLQSSLAALYSRNLGTQPTTDFQTAANVVAGATTPAPASP